MNRTFQKKRLRKVGIREVLSKREIQVLKLICDEKSSAEIASELKIVLKTVQKHKKNLYDKTKSRSSIGLFKYALKNNMIKFRYKLSTTKAE